MNIKQLIENAEAGDMKAQSSLACLYQEGDGVPQDDEKAFYWVKKAAAQEDMYAMYNLGYTYLRGEVISEITKKLFIGLAKQLKKDTLLHKIT